MAGIQETGFKHQDPRPRYGQIEGIDDFNAHLISAKTNFLIPYSFAEELGFENLDLKLTLDGKNPMLLVGGVSKNSSVNEALATVQISQKENEKRASRLAISGINSQNRIVAAEFDLNNSNRIKNLNISLAVKEISMIEQSNPGIIERLTIKLPTDERKETAGLITPTMCEKAGVVGNNARALVFQFLPGRNFTVGKPKNLAEKTELRAKFQALGYRAFEYSKFITVWLSTITAKNMDIKPWEIEIPKYLPR